MTSDFRNSFASEGEWAALELDSGRFSSVVNLVWSSSNLSVVVFYLTQVAMNMVYLPGFEILSR